MGDLAEMAVEDGGDYATVDLDDDLDRHLGALPHADLDALPPEGVAAATPGGSAEQPWAGIPYVSTKAGLDPTRLRLVAMLLRLGFDQTQVENLGGMPGTDDLGAWVQRKEIVGDGNTDSPLWANAAFIAAAIAILGPEYIVPRVAPGLVAHADVLAAIRRGRASSRA
jgi:hypothetical protein